LLDLMMPVMDGFEFRREQLKEPRLAAIPVVVLSAIARSRASDLRGCAAFDKPIDVFEVAEIVRQLRSLGPSPPEGSLPAPEPLCGSGRSIWPGADLADIVRPGGDVVTLATR
jgi:hypothetical protein